MILVVGKGGQLGTAFGKALGAEVVQLGQDDLDLRMTNAIKPALDDFDVSAIVNTAAYTHVDAAESEPDDAFLVNAVAVQHMAEWAAARHIPFVTFSTDYVFDGGSERPYVESDHAVPLSVYGSTKLAGERMALEAYPGSLVVRTSWLLSGDHPNFLASILRKAPEGDLRVVDDQVGVPNVAADVAEATMKALAGGWTGLIHLSSSGETTWYGLACAGIELAGLDPGTVTPVSTGEYPTAAVRPEYSVLGTEIDHGIELPSWRDSLPAVVSGLLAWV
jgi:dTDP-4-dehydrorhamnose reductase